jgi:heme o synthase
MTELAIRTLPATGATTILGALFRLAKPGIVVAETMAGLTGMVLAARRLPDPTLLACALCCLAMAAAGAAMLNGILDRRADRRLARLNRRCQALTLAGIPLVLTTALLLLTGALTTATILLNTLSALLLMAGTLTYLLYTWLKRHTPWGVIPGGIPGALPALIGSAAATGTIGYPALLLFTIIFLWQPPHFWFLALHYQDQYRQAGIPVLPLTHGVTVTRLFIFLYASAMLPCTLALWLLGFCSAWYGAAALLLGALFLTFCYRSPKGSASFGTGFSVSILYLLLLCLAIILDIGLRTTSHLSMLTS